MKIEYTGRQTEVAPEIRRLAERKLAKLARVLPGITSVHVVLGADKRRQVVEVTVQSRHLTLAASEESPEQAVSLTTVMDKLTRQAQRHQGRLHERKRRAPARGAAPGAEALARPAPGDGGPRVVRSRRFVAKPMTVDEAILEVGASDEGLLVFRDANTERVSVLYRRKDGNLGLIEPEA